MYKEHAHRILGLLNKDLERGIILHADAAQAIATLESAVANSRAHPVSDHVTHDINIHPQPNATGDHDHAQVDQVSFASRVFPLLEMLKAAHKDGFDVVWGV